MGRGEKVINQKLQQITQPKHAMVLDDLDSSLLNKGITKQLRPLMGHFGPATWTEVSPNLQIETSENKMLT